MLGIVQGLTEFAPISSSGHLILVPWLFGWGILEDESLNKTFDVALHVGTFVGGLAYFWRDISRYVAAWGRSIARRRVETTDQRVAWALVVGTVPGVVVGALAEDVIQGTLGAPWLVAIMLAAFGALLYVVDRLAPKRRGVEELRMLDGLIVGTAQAVALQPGVSRSGVTMTAARWLGLTREASARFSFLLALPIVGGAGAYKGLQVLVGEERVPPGAAWPFVWGTVAAAASGFLVIWALLAYLRRRDFAPFILYRFAVSALVLGLIAAGVRPASV